jgi:tripartite-type tricarboxylate transporter receptor subunit TctC
VIAEGYRQEAETILRPLLAHAVLAALSPEPSMKRLLCLMAGLLAAALCSAQPAGNPSHVTIIVGGPAGTPGDTIARSLSEPLARELGRPVVVENRPGAAGTLALAAVSRAGAEAGVLGIFALQSAVAPSLIKSMPYDTARDLVAVRQISTVTNVLVVRADSPLADVATLLRHARQGKLTYASAGMGTPSHLAAELFAQEATVALQHIPFNGPVAALTALVGGHVDMMFATTPAAVPMVRSSRLRPVAVTSTHRLASLPDVPTLTELGYPQASVRDWHGVVAPAGTPQERIDQIAAALGRILSGEGVRDRLQSSGLEPVADSGPAEFRRFMSAEMERWSRVLLRAGVALQ